MSGEQTTADFDALQERLGELDQRVNQLAGHLGRLLAERKPRGEQAWWWPSLDKQQAAQAWETLACWVNECLIPRFPEHARTLRPCWRRHADVVDELTALRVLWVDAYTNPQARPMAAAEYRGRWVPQAMDRIEKAFRTAHCTPNSRSTHGDDPDAPLPGWNEEELACFLDTDLQARPDQSAAQ